MRDATASSKSATADLLAASPEPIVADSVCGFRLVACARPWNDGSGRDCSFRRGGVADSVAMAPRIVFRVEVFKPKRSDRRHLRDTLARFRPMEVRGVA